MSRKPLPRVNSVPFRTLLLVALAAVAVAARAEEPVPVAKLEEIAPEWATNPAVHMIAIEALIIEIDEDKTRELGLKTSFVRKGTGGVVPEAGMNFGAPGNPVGVPQPGGGSVQRLPGLGLDLTGFDIAGGVFSAKLRTLLERGEAHIVTRPLALAVNGTPALIDVGSRVPYQDFSAAGLPVIAEQTIGVTMEVTPTITNLAEQTVELNIAKLQVTSLSSMVTIEQVDRPAFNNSQTVTRFTMRSGETARVSSFKGRRKAHVKTGVPGLMHIPFVGRLFSGVSEQSRAVDVLFFITPQIVSPGRNAVIPYDFNHGRDLVDQGVALEN